MSYKKLLLVFVAALLVINLVACNTADIGSSETTTGETTLHATSETSAEPEETSEATTQTSQNRDPFARVPLNNTQQGTEYFSPVLGLCEDYPRGTAAYSIKRDFALMAKYGIKDIRVSIAWGDYEPVKGEFRWDLLDEKVRYAEEYGIELYPYICYSPYWATGTSDWRSPPEDLQDWYDFVYTVADRYKGRITHWELWNEGDNRDFWTGSWIDQLRLIKKGAEAVKAADPEATTILGGLTNLSPSHIDTIFSSGLSDYIDVINIHFYNETWNRAPTEQIYETTRFVADVIRRNDASEELWIAEIGYSDYVEEDGQVSGWYQANFPYEKTRQYQAVTFFRALSRIYATQDVSTVLWYEVKNLRLDSVAIGDVNNYHLGALDHDYFPKHLWFAIATAKKLFAAPFKAIDDEITINAGESGIRPFVHAFQRENGDVVLLAWNRGSDSGNIKVTIPGIFTSALRYSVTGEKTSSGFSSSGGQTELELELQPEYMHIIELFAGEVPGRLTIENQKLEQIDGGKYLVEADIVNAGGMGIEEAYAEIIINKAIAIENETETSIAGLEPGERITVSWEIEIIDSAEEPQLWLAIREENSAPAAILLEVPQE